MLKSTCTAAARFVEKAARFVGNAARFVENAAARFVEKATFYFQKTSCRDAHFYFLRRDGILPLPLVVVVEAMYQ